MALEACMFIVDNSEYTRNGDFNPSRLQAIVNSVGILCRNKTESNPETSVGLVDTSGPTCHMSLVTVHHLEKLLASLHKVEVKGQTHLSSAVNVAMLALKHRVNKRQEQRVVAFVASPVSETEKELQSLGVRLKKNKVAIDIVSFGEDELNSTKLQTLVNSANNNDNCHYVPIATSSHVVLTDELAKSPVFSGIMAAGPSMDDELEMAIRLSLQDAGGNAAIPPAAAGGNGNGNNGNAMAVDGMDDDLARAIALSLQDGQDQGETGNNNNNVAPQGNRDAMDMDEDMELAIKLSMQDHMDEDAPHSSNTASSNENPAENTKKEEAKEEEEGVSREFIQNLVSNVDGLDPNDPAIKELLESLKEDEKKEEK